ncbi:TON1 Recruiting Motif 19 [Hibiscus trionum]|uniref:TON1 Recruiting Motif 19 n=1 Tax=Hibiscus trionum TaxID=183268 RepID=A0A9W7LPI9_HIBTR|nr:TON1 Recruiting Motif 19 [Hibiscus trionum]
METFGQRRPKISSFSSDQTLIDLLPSTAPSSLKGNRNIQKQRNFPKLASDTSSCSSDTTDEDKLTFELTSTSSKQSTWTPMKKLLVGEMSKENESRRRPPSVIARLMGLDGLPPQQPGHRQQKGIENSREKVQKGNTLNGRQSSRKSSKEEQEFKDVFEVLGALEMESAGYSSQRTANSNLSDAEVAFIRQKFMEAKRLSTDEKLQDSEEFNDTLEVLDSNTDLLLKFFQQPDSLFTKHLHDLRGVPPQSHFGRVSAMKSLRTLNNENGSLALKNGRETRTKRRSKSPQCHQEDCLSHTHGRFAAHNPPKSPTFQIEEKNGPAIVPTRIVVLKPNLGKLQNSSKTVSSPRSSHHFPSKCTRHSEILGVQNKEAEVWGKNKVHQDTGFSRHNTRDPRKMAKEIARKMKNSFNNSSMTISTSTLRGYAGDESSCDATGSESANDSDVTTVSYKDNIDWKKRHRRSSSHSSESSVSREAKKRLSERWKLTHKSQEVHAVSRGSTLGEMLATSDREVIPANSSGLVGVEGCNKFGRRVEPAVCNEPLGISSRDGWKDGCLGNLSRSRSLPASSTGFGSPRVCTRHESILREKYVIPKEGFKWDRNKAVKGNLNPKEAPLPSNRRSRVKTSQFLGSSCNDKEYSDTQRDSDISPYQVMQNKQSEQILMVSEASVGTVVDSSSVLQNAADVNDLNNSVLSEPSHMELSPPASLNAAVASPSDLDNLDSQEPSEGPSKQTTPHCPVSELPLASTKEAEQPSPVSVIEAPFADDVSSGSECFESISADLHELRMQLRQLKLESEAYEEGTMLLSSDDDSNEVSVGFAEDNGEPNAEENWGSTYIVDVLVDSGIGRAELDTFLAAWHSPECPVNPLVFQELEKKYCNVNSWSRAERRLMFDRINSKILEIYQQYREQPWIVSGRKIIIIPKCDIEELEDSLRKSLVSQNKKPRMDEEEMVFAREFQWLDLRSDIDKIGRGIERLLVYELVSEIVAG